MIKMHEEAPQLLKAIELIKLTNISMLPLSKLRLNLSVRKKRKNGLDIINQVKA
jgi:hypothetical protein